MPQRSAKPARTQKPIGEPRPVVSFDFYIKRIFRNKADYRILEGFLSELFKKSVKIKAVLESASNAEKEGDKTNSVDVKVEIDKKEVAIVEVQFAYECDFFLGILFGVSKALTEQLKKGDKYDKINKVYSVDVVYFNLGKGEDYVYYGDTSFKGLHTGIELKLDEDQQELFGKKTPNDIYPSYYLVNVRQFGNKVKDKLDEWIFYLKNYAVKDDFSAKGMDAVRDDLDYQNLSRELQLAYDKDIDRLTCLDTAFWDAERKGFKSGRAEGRAEGKAEGRAEGLAEGEHKKALDTARKMKAKGYSIKDIAEIIGLSEVEIGG